MSTEAATRTDHDVFVSYAREDQAFVQRLTEALGERGKRAWVDWADIPPTAEWMAEIRAAIDAADTYVVVLSPASIRSKICAAELDSAIQANKRIVPVLAREVDNSAVPDQVGKLNWVSFTNGFDPAVDRLVEALDTDLDHVRTHTRLLVRAREWETKDQDKALLVRGRELGESEAWLSGSGSKEPPPTSLHTRFLLASRKAATRRQRGAITGVTAMFLVAALFAGVAFHQRNVAVHESRTERSRELAAAAVANLDTDPALALDLALEAARTERNAETEDALKRSVLAQNLEHRLAPAGDPFGAEPDTREIDTIESVAYEPDGTLVTGGGDGVIATWNTATGQLERTLTDTHGWVVGLGVTPDGQIVAGGRAGIGGALFQGRGFVWVLAPDGTVVDRARLKGDDVHTLAVSPDGGVVATAGERGVVRLWILAGDHMKLIKTLDPQPGNDEARQIFALAFDPPGRSLAVGTATGAVRVYDVPTGKMTAQLSGHQGAVTDAVFTPDGTTLITAGQDRLVRLWNASTWQPAGILPQPVRLRAIAVSPDGTLLATADNAGVGRVWDLQTQEVVTDLIGHESWLTDVAFSPDGRRVATSSADDTAAIWRAGDTVPSMTATATGAIGTMSVLGAGNVLITDKAGAAILDPSNGRVIRRFPTTLPDGTRIGPATTAAASPDGATIVTGHRGGRAVMWSAGGTFVRSLEREPHVVYTGAAYAPNGSTFLLDGYEVDPNAGFFMGGGGTFPQPPGHVSFYDAKTGRRIPVYLGLHGLQSPVGAAAIAPDGALAGVWTQGMVTLFNVDKRSGDGDVFDTIATAQSADEQQGSVAFSPDGKQVLVPGPRGALSFYDLAELAPSGNPSPVGTIQTRHGALTDIGFSPDGTFLATAGVDGVVRVWTATPDHALVMEFPVGSSQQGLAQVKFAQPDVFAPVHVSFAPDGTHLVAATGTGLVRTFTCDLCVGFDELVSVGESRVTRELSPDERIRYLGAS